MSERFGTYVGVSGPNAVVAKQAVIETLRSISSEKYHGRWTEENDASRFANSYFDHDSGQIAVLTVGWLSRQFPTEAFVLEVVGGCGEGCQGPVFINNGRIRDGRSVAESYGSDEQEPLCEPCKQQLSIPSEGKGQVTCPTCGRLYEYDHRELTSRQREVYSHFPDGERPATILYWFEMWEAPTEIPVTLQTPEEQAAEKAHAKAVLAEEERRHAEYMRDHPEGDADISMEDILGAGTRRALTKDY